MTNQDLYHEINELHAGLCSALADPRRIMIIYTLAEGSMNVNDLANAVGISQPATSRHLKILRDRGLVKAVRHGTSIEYQLKDVRLVEALDLLRDVLFKRISDRVSLLEVESTN